MFAVNRKIIFTLGTFLFFLCAAAELISFQAEEKKSSPLKFSFSHRFRFVTWDNAIHLDRDAGSGSTFSRHRTSLGVAFKPNDRWEASVKVTNEFRLYYKPTGRPFNINEFFIDNLFIRAKPFRLPLVITAGRQNIMLGEGFVVMDGHPLDGSRSIYFNAFRLDFQPGKNHNLTTFWTYQPERDAWLPIINKRDQPLIEQPEEGIGLYYSGKTGKVLLDVYAIRKTIHRTETQPIRSLFMTWGARLAFPLDTQFSMAGEAAYQAGSFGKFGRSAFGGYFHLDFTLPEESPLPGILTLGGIFLSGDKPGTPAMEGWDPLFSRWPKWSEAYIYTLIPEYQGRVAYWSNLSSVYSTINIQPHRSAGLILTYHRLYAHKRNVSSSFFGTGRTRGDLFITKLNLKFSKSLSGHILWERFIPGNFYRTGADRYHWFRIEILYRY